MEKSARPSSGVAERPFDVIVVEDDADLQAVLVTALRIDGCLVRAFPAAWPARTAALAKVPDVVLTDLHLDTPPSGWELARTLRHELSTRSVGLVALTGQELDASQLHPFDAYLLKPVEVDVLIQIVRERAAFSRAQRHKARAR